MKIVLLVISQILILCLMAIAVGLLIRGSNVHSYKEFVTGHPHFIYDSVNKRTQVNKLLSRYDSLNAAQKIMSDSSKLCLDSCMMYRRKFDSLCLIYHDVNVTEKGFRLMSKCLSKRIYWNDKGMEYSSRSMDLLNQISAEIKP